ncbi:MAG: hypothetical protein MUE69_20740 [Myxococcota bacterium]|jgi:hypothetical protein|nr:hypothetical protein [Myxococcota bacterium]
MRLVCSLLICCACGASSATARRFGGEAIDCREQDVEATMLVHDVFEVVGCDRTVVVRCHGREVCEAVEPGTVPEPPRSVGPDERRAESGEALGSPRSGATSPAATATSPAAATTPAATRPGEPDAREPRRTAPR